MVELARVDRERLDNVDFLGYDAWRRLALCLDRSRDAISTNIWLADNDGRIITRQ